jgi:hypothetical protein
MPQQIDVRDHRKCNDHDSLSISQHGSRRIVAMIVVDIAPSMSEYRLGLPSDLTFLILNGGGFPARRENIAAVRVFDMTVPARILCQSQNRLKTSYNGFGRSRGCTGGWARILWTCCLHHDCDRGACFSMRQNFAKMACPIARSLERLGAWWSTERAGEHDPWRRQHAGAGYGDLGGCDLLVPLSPCLIFGVGKFCVVRSQVGMSICSRIRN